ncbi:MAG: M48 family metallopeptidase [Planctomycetes bacterium]|nr:M48 family metallopeptidase [Planctomycetota bacterium]
MTDRSDQTSSAIHADQPTVRALPADVTFNDLIRANKRKSMLLMIGMGLLVVLLGAAISAMLAVWGGGDITSLVPSVIVGTIVAVIVAVIASTWSFYGGSKAILRIAGAVPIQHKDDPQLFNVVEELSIAAGTPMPQVYLINDPAMNAFATGRDPAHGAVAITTGLRAKLSRDELAGVMAHEISHIRHYDIRFAMLMATMVGLIVFASDAFWRIMWYGSWHGTGRRSARGGSKGSGAIVLIIMVIAIVLAIIAPMLAMLIRFAVSRQREFLADAGAVELTRYPQGMIGALEKLGACKEPLKGANRATAHLFIVNPLKNALKGKGHELSSTFRTHPPLHDRIARLRALIQ